MPPLLVGPSELHDTARRIRVQADDLRRRAVGLVRAADTAHWRSPAATAFRARVEGLAARIRTAAGHLDTAAESLDRHARQVGHALSTVEHAVAGAARVLIP